MNKATDPVLEILDRAHPIWIMRSEVIYNIEQFNENTPSDQTVYTAFEQLEPRDFVERRDDHFRITERGRKYLVGELDASDLDPDASGD